MLLSCSPKSYKIAIIGDVEGSSKSYVDNALISAHHAVEDMGLDWEFITVQYNTDDLEKIIEEESIDFFIGPYLSRELMDSYANLYNLDIPVFVGSTTSNFLNDKSDYFYRLALSNQIFGELIADDLMTHDYDSILFLYDINNESFTLENVNIISSELVGIDYKLFTLNNNIDLPDNHSEYEVIYIVASPDKSGTAIQKIRQSNNDSTIYLGPWASNPRVVDSLGGLSENILLHTSNYSDKPFYADYRSRFIAETGDDLAASSFFTYEIINLLNTMSKEVDLSNGSLINSYIKDNPYYEGVFITVTIDDVGNSNGIIHTLKIIDGEVKKE